MLGAIVGDIVGSIYEFQNHRSKDFPLFTPRNHFTDDSVCTVALAYAELAHSDPVMVLQSWCRRYPARGYGGGFHNWIRSEKPSPYGSYGNGAAMRVSVAGWLATSLEDAEQRSDRITQITHNHPEGLRGARAVATSIFLALNGAEPQQITKVVAEVYRYDLTETVDEIRDGYKFYESCQQTVPQALVCALTAKSFEDAIRNAVSIGGDSDTVAAIAGSVAEPLYGIPQEIAQSAIAYLPDEFVTVTAKVKAKRGTALRVPLR